MAAAAPPPAKRPRAASPAGGEAASPPPRRERLSATPRVDYYPHFLSADECDALAALAARRSDAWRDAGGEGDAPCEYSFQFLAPLDRHFQACVRAVEARVAAATRVEAHNGEDPLKVSRHAAAPPRAEQKRAPREAGDAPASDASAPLLNLHHDANTARPRRVATAVMYLSDVAAGGGTFFPCADAVKRTSSTADDDDAGDDVDAALRAGEPAALEAALSALYADGTCMLPTRPGREDGGAAGAALCGANALCARLAGEQRSTGAPWVRGATGGLLVAPRRGAAVVFWSAISDAAADDDSGVAALAGSCVEASFGAPLAGAAWHGAAAVLSGVKLAAQKFKEAPQEDAALHARARSSSDDDDSDAAPAAGALP
jgi:hypothetical protein